jgi:hypothetical protein
MVVTHSWGSKAIFSMYGFFNKICLKWHEREKPNHRHCDWDYIARKHSHKMV